MGEDREEEKKKKEQLTTNYHRNHQASHPTWKGVPWRFQHHCRS